MKTLLVSSRFNRLALPKGQTSITLIKIDLWQEMQTNINTFKRLSKIRFWPNLTLKTFNFTKNLATSKKSKSETTTSTSKTNGKNLKSKESRSSINTFSGAKYRLSARIF